MGRAGRGSRPAQAGQRDQAARPVVSAVPRREAPRATAAQATRRVAPSPRKHGRAGPSAKKKAGPPSTPPKERARNAILRCRDRPCQQGLSRVTPDSVLCYLGLTADRCAYEHVAASVPKGREGDKSNRLCPCHDDRKASLSINPGKIVRVAWCCGAA